ncbi:hypothetical protein R6Q57_025176 [Mikania cordata]
MPGLSIYPGSKKGWAIDKESIPNHNASRWRASPTDSIVTAVEFNHQVRDGLVWAPTPHRNCLPETVPWPVGPG